MRRRLRRYGLFVLAGGLAVVLGGPFLIPVPPLTGTFPPQALADDDSEFIEIKGLDIHVKKMGQGEPVFVLLHGFAASLYSWHAVMEPLSQIEQHPCQTGREARFSGRRLHPTLTCGQVSGELD